MTARRPASFLGLIAAALLVLAACSQPASPDGQHGEVIGFLLPESKTARYEGVDRPAFERVVAARCPTCTLLTANADQDAERQQQQAESMLTRGAGVLVIDAVDAVAAISIVNRAHELGVPVIAYDRFIADANLDFYVSFDPRHIGRLQGEALVASLLAERSGPEDEVQGVLLVNGSATDPNSAGLRAGVGSALEGTGIEILAEHDTPDWSPEKAQEWVTGQLPQFADRVDAVYAANDGMAGGVVAALRAAGRVPVPPVTGQDAELAALQRIVAGDQLMTVYKALDQQARTAAELAVRILRGEQPRPTAVVDGVPALLLTPVSLTIENLGRVIVDGGVYSLEEICVEPYTRACIEAGLLTEGDG
ncbi:MAG: sugar ABC transporter substrate-binding protein [Actinomycetales bacterium]|nr:sugar ABC transporter substrate-binding protein [Actinomycetales bacterium]